MVKTDFTLRAFLNEKLLTLILFVMCSSTSLVKAQCPAMSSNDAVQISVDNNCEILFDADMLLEGDVAAQGASFTLIIEKLGINGPLPAAQLGTSFISPFPLGTWDYKVLNQCGNSVWGKIIVEDNIPPVATSPVDCTLEGTCSIPCYEEDWVLNKLDLTGPNGYDWNPTFTDNCDNLGGIGYIDEIEDLDLCGQKQITRQWYVTYLSHGEKVTRDLVTQYFNLDPVDIGRVMCPMTNFEVPCTSNGSMASIADYFDDPDTDINEGIPYAYPYIYDAIKDQNIAINPLLCNLAASKTDQVTIVCGVGDKATRKILRTWTIIDWCGASSRPCLQVFKVGDSEGPTIDCQASLFSSTDPWVCAANVDVPKPKHLFDNCSPDNLVSYTVKVEGVHGVQLVGNATIGYTLVGVPKGLYDLVYTAKDACGNTNECITELTVEDRTPPVAIAKENIVVSLTSSPFDGKGIAKIFTNSIDNGSYDACGPVHLEIRREVDNCDILGNDTYNSDGHPQDLEGLDEDDNPLVDPDNGAYVKFCCSDLDKVTEGGVRYGELKVWMRVWDDGDMDGEYGTEGDNYNEVWAIVRVEDKQRASIVCPPMAVIDCDEDALPSETGYAVATSSCGDLNVGYYDRDGRNECASGNITRVWYIDLNGNGELDGSEANTVCEQVIKVRDSRAFDPRSIKWPPHYTGAKYQGKNREWNNAGTAIIESDDEIMMYGAVDCADDFTACKPEWGDPACGLVGYSVKVDTFHFADNACLKIVKHWTVIDWCVWQPNDDDNDGLLNDRDDDHDSSCELFEAVSDWTLTDDSCLYDEDGSMYFRYKRDFRLSDLAPTLIGDLTAVFSSTGTIQDVRNLINRVLSLLCITYNYSIALELNNGSTVIIDDLTFAEIASAVNAGGGIDEVVIRAIVDVDGYYTFDQVIKVVDNQKPVLTGCVDKRTEVGPDCKAELIIKNSATDNGDCPSTELEWVVDVFDVHWNKIWSGKAISLSGAELVINVSNKTGKKYMAGLYRVTWKVEDGCGNFTTCTTECTIEDKKAPTPYCIQSISTTVMQQAGIIAIWAVDFNLNSDDNCTPKGNLRYSFSGDEIKPSVTISCVGLGGDYILTNGKSDTFDLKMWVWDESNNKDYCTVQLIVQDNVGVCPDVSDSSITIAGTLMNELGVNISEASVLLTSTHPEYPKQTITTGNGYYAFMDNPEGYKYQIEVERNDDYMNGVSTLDLVLIQKHILGLQLLDSPYKVIAADINGDQSISAIDLVELRKLILGYYNELPTNDSWRFVAASQTFNNAMKPWPFMEIMDLGSLQSSRSHEDFVGVKIGDVSEDSKANNLISTEVRSNGKLRLIADDQGVKAGDVVNMVVSGENFKDVSGYQFTLNHAGLELLSVSNGDITLDASNVRTSSGMTAISWNTQGEAVSTSASLFTLSFRADHDVQLSNAVSINSRLVKAEAYVGSDLTQNDVELNFRTEEGIVSATAFELYQNTPNPFADQTVISFNLPKAGEATLSIMDVTGKRIHQITQDFNRGFNEVVVDRAILGSAGVLYYQLSSDQYSATKKMVVIK